MAVLINIRCESALGRLFFLRLAAEALCFPKELREIRLPNDVFSVRMKTMADVWKLSRAGFRHLLVGKTPVAISNGVLDFGLVRELQEIERAYRS